MPRLLLAALLAAGVAVPAAAQTAPGSRKAADPKRKAGAGTVPGYTSRKIEGFQVLLADEVLARHEDGEFDRRPIDVLELELGTVARVLPRRAVDVLRTVPIWVEWDDTSDPDHGVAVAKYYGLIGNRAIWSLGKGKHPGKANAVEVVSMKSLTEEHQPGVKLERCVLLHELAHAVHFHVVGRDNAGVRAAYAAAMDRGLYDESRTAAGRKVKPYASSSEHEYFAELTCAYLDKLHYYPHTRDDLKAHDPAGYKVMELIWGPAKRIDAGVKVQAEQAAAARLARAKGLLADKKAAEGRRQLRLVADVFPATPAGAEAKKLLAKLDKE